MALNLVLRTASAADTLALQSIESDCFPEPHWSADDFLHYDCTVAETDGAIVGFVVSRKTFEGSAAEPAEHEILNLAVARRFQRLGIAVVLLQHELDRGGSIFLEVRESNRAARALYSKVGFQQVSRRKAYYQNPEESALVMRMKW